MNMKKILISLLALVMTVMTASAYDLTKASDAEAHGTITFKVGENSVTSANENDVVTVIVTPADGWAVGSVTGQWYAAVAATRSIDLLKDITLTAVEGQENTWTFTMARANAEISVTYKKLLSNSDITVVDISDQIYTGAAIEPTITVKDGETTLTLGTDYTVAYTDNIYPGTATVTVTGIGNYSGTATATFIIYIPEYTVSIGETEHGTVSVATDFVAVGDEVTVTATPEDDYELVSITIDGEPIEGNTFVMPDYPVTISATFKRKEYTITVAQPEHGTVSASAEKSISGETITVTATPEEGYYLGSITVNGEAVSGESFVMPKSNVTVSASFKEFGDVSSAVVTLDWTTTVYNGELQQPAVTSVAIGETALGEGDYSIGYENSVDAGTYSVTVTATGERLKGSTTAAYTIEKATLTAKADDKGCEQGSAIPELTLSIEGFVNGETEAVLTEWPTASTEATAESAPGTYEIVVSGGDAKNYAFDYVSGVLTVAKIPETGEEVTISDEDGTAVEATVTDVKTDEETGETVYEVTLNTVPEEVLNGTAELETTTYESNGQTFEVTGVDAAAFENLQEGVIVQLPEGVSTTGDVTNVVNGDGTCSTLDLTNVERFEMKQTVTADAVIYNRTVEEAKFGVCLPYEFTLPEGVTAYTLQNGEGGKATFVVWGSRLLNALTPYMLDVDMTVAAARRAGGTVTIDLGTTDAVIDPTLSTEVIAKDDLEFCGTITGLTHAEGAEQGAYIMQPDYSWQMTAVAEEGDKLYLPPFQAYLRVKDSAGSTGESGIDTTFDETTGIRDINATKTSSDMEGWYDLGGRRLETAPKAKGVYLKDGKKVVVK